MTDDRDEMIATLRARISVLEDRTTDGLTKKRISLLKFIHDFMEKNDRPPTYRKMADEFKISQSSVYEMCSELYGHGWLSRGERSGSVELTPKAREIVARQA